MNNLSIRKSKLETNQLLNTLSIHLFIYSLALLVMFPESRNLSVYIGIILANIFMMIVRKTVKVFQ